MAIRTPLWHSPEDDVKPTAPSLSPETLAYVRSPIRLHIFTPKTWGGGSRRGDGYSYKAPLYRIEGDHQ